MIDPGILGRLTAETMEEIEEHYGEHAELMRAMLVFEVRYPDEDDVDKTRTDISWNDTMESPTEKVGLLLVALRGFIA